LRCGIIVAGVAVERLDPHRSPTTVELLSSLLSQLETGPRRAPEMVVILIQRELNRLDAAAVQPRSQGGDDTEGGSP
jgi:hypothetical protein